MLTEAYPWEAYAPGYDDLFGYLLTDAAQARYVLAAHYVRDCDHIVEIGGYKVPITNFVTTVPKSILVLDPATDAFHSDALYGQPCRVDHVTKTFQDHDFEVEAGTYGLVVIGLSLKFFSKDEALMEVEWARLVELINGAQLSVLETPVNCERGENNIAHVLDVCDVRVKVRLDLDICANAGVHPDYCTRQFMVLVPDGAD